MSCLYHYCSNEKCFSILKGKTIRLSDIEKSNDYMELSLFFPRILDAIDDLYRKKPFRFKFNKKYDSDYDCHSKHNVIENFKRCSLF